MLFIKLCEQKRNSPDKLNELYGLIYLEYHENASKWRKNSDESSIKGGDPSWMLSKSRIDKKVIRKQVKKQNSLLCKQLIRFLSNTHAKWKKQTVQIIEKVFMNQITRKNKTRYAVVRPNSKMTDEDLQELGMGDDVCIPVLHTTIEVADIKDDE